MFNQSFLHLANKIIIDKVRISQSEALDLAEADPQETLDLIVCAGKISRAYKKNAVFKCAIINAKSGMCPENCAFCAQSAHHETQTAIYDLLSPEKIEAEGLKMAAAGATHYSVVTSGTSLNDKDVATICSVAERLKVKTRLTLCASVGLLNLKTARLLRSAGIDRYHHNLETARSYFDKICTTHDYNDDIQTVQVAQEAGLVVCSGGILGMGESWAQRVELAFTLRELDVDSIPVNFLNPIKGTQLQNSPLLGPLEALKVIALFRFIHPDKDITICGGRERTLQDFQSWVFAAGANGLMIGNYLTTQGRDLKMDLDMIQALGLSDAQQ